MNLVALTLLFLPSVKQLEQAMVPVLEGLSTKLLAKTEADAGESLSPFVRNSMTVLMKYNLD